MSLQLANKPYSVNWKDWIKSHLFPVEFIPEHESTFVQDFYAAFRETYETDGVNISDGSYTLASDFIDSEQCHTHNWSGWEEGDGHSLTEINHRNYRLIHRYSEAANITALQGLPSRPTSIYSFNQNPLLTLKQFGKNLIGGWDSDPKISREKKIWQWIALPFKIVIIAPLKLILMPFKYALNMVKMVTELMPLLLATLTARLLGAYRGTRIGGAAFPALEKYKEDFGIAMLTLLLVTLFKIPHLILGTLYYAFRILALVGRAITSPEKSARMAFDYCRELQITAFGKSKAGIRAGKFFSFLFGVIGGLLSISLSATLWIITLPVTISFISTGFPAVAQFMTWVSQLPAVTATLSWFSQFPLITTSLGAAHGLLNSLGLALATAFGPAIGAFAGIVGVNITASVMVTGTALALIAAPITTILTRIGDDLSNLWHSWTNSGPFTRLYRYTQKSKLSTAEESTLLGDATELQATAPANEHDFDAENDSAPTPSVRSLVAKIDRSGEVAVLVSKQADDTFKEYFRPGQQGKLRREVDFAELSKFEAPDLFHYPVSSIN